MWRSEISLEDIPVHTPGQPPLVARPPIQNISGWVGKFSVMAALRTSRFSEKAPELIAYQGSIMRAEHNFDGRRYRHDALAQKNLNWSVPNAHLYNEAFTGHTRMIPRCSFSLQEDQTSKACPRNPNRPWFGWLPDPGTSTHTPYQGPPATHPAQSTEYTIPMQW